jgi:hypothetical protein
VSSSSSLQRLDRGETLKPLPLGPTYFNQGTEVASVSLATRLPTQPPLLALPTRLETLPSLSVTFSSRSASPIPQPSDSSQVVLRRERILEGELSSAAARVSRSGSEDPLPPVRQRESEVPKLQSPEQQRPPPQQQQQQANRETVARPVTQLVTQDETQAGICQNEKCNQTDNSSVTPVRPILDIADHIAREPHPLDPNNLAVGGRQAIAAIYQSCDVLKMEAIGSEELRSFSKLIQAKKNNNVYLRYVPEPEKLKAQHPYLKGLKGRQQSIQGDSSQCVDVQKQPPLFQYGKRVTSQRGDRNNLRMETHNFGPLGRAPALDCSAFVSLAMSVAGLKFYKQTRDGAGNLIDTNTVMGEVRKRPPNPQFCFEEPTFTAQESLKTGDMITYKGHIFILDKVGPDPFKLKEKLQKGQIEPRNRDGCNKLSFSVEEAKKLDMEIIQAESRGLPGMRNKAEVVMSNIKITNGFRYLMEAACYALVESQFSNSNNSGQKVNYNQGHKSSAKFEENHRITIKQVQPLSLLRHKSRDPECLFAQDKKPQFDRMKCTGQCLPEATQ